MVLARSAEAHRALNGQFASHTVTKRYHALVRGLPPWEEKRVELYLRVDGDRRHRTAVSDAASGHPAGKPAVTCLRVIERL
jgi:tRNA pseudouridine32 synthase/23S rRNA pseudouridine746 synthase